MDCVRRNEYLFICNISLFSIFILIFLLLAVPLLEMIPNTALAAMLITVAFKLAHPMELVHIFKIGKEQLGIFLVTIFFTLFEDLLLGIFAGMLVKMITEPDKWKL